MSGMFNIEAEQALLGALMENNERADVASGILKPEHFYEPTHGAIYEAILAMRGAGSRSDATTLRTQLENHDGLKELGGAPYLVKLQGASIGASAFMDYAHLIESEWRRRTLKRELEGAMASVEGSADAEDGRTAVEKVLAAIPEPVSKARTVSSLKAVTDAIVEMNAVFRGEAVGVPTGFDVTDKRLGGFFKQNLIILAGRPSMGKAQPLDSPVLTKTGFLPMGDLKVGDELASVDGERSVVTGIFPQGRVAMARVTFADGRVVRCCMDHLWKLKGSFFRGEEPVMTTQELMSLMRKPRAKGRVSVPLFEGDYGISTILPLDPWFVGAFLGNGYARTTGVRFSTDDAQTLWKVTEAVRGEAETVYTGTGYDYRIRGLRKGENQVLNRLRDLGIADCVAQTKFIPQLYLNADRNVRLAVLQGLLDTDGWVESFGAVRFSTSSGRMAAEVQRLVWSIGGVCSVSTKEPKYEHNGEKRTGLTHYVLNIKHDDPASLFTIERKKKRCRRTKPVRLGVISVETDGEDEAQCISVSHPSRLYVTDDFVVTHNTALALGMAGRAAQSGKVVAIVSREMSSTELMHRFIAAEANIEYRRFRRSDLSEDEFRKAVAAAKKIEGYPFEIVPDHVAEVPAIRAALRAIRQKHGRLDLVVVDYLQLLTMPGYERSTTNDRVSAISAGLKGIAKELDVPVVALSQLSRGVETREDKHPLLSDLRDSGSIEQDADVVLFCYRHAYYLERQQPPTKDAARADYEAELKACRNLMEVITAKQRQGSIGVDMIGCHMGTNRFWNLHNDHEDF